MDFLSQKNKRNLCCFLLCVALSIVAWVILHDASWILGDDELFLRTTAMGRPSHAWTGQGRFWPLGLCDYSILLALPFELTVQVHLVYNIIMMVASVLLMFNILNKITDNSYGISLFTMATFLLSVSFVQIHMSCIYPERCMFFMQTLFMYCWYKAKTDNSVIFYALAFIFASYVIFSKEPAFGMIAAIALTHLIFNRKQIDVKEKCFCCSLMFSSIAYLAIYVYRWFFRDHRADGVYGNTGTIFASNVDVINVVKLIIENNPLLILIFVLGAIRAYYVVIKSDTKTIWIDALLFGGMAYSFAYFLLAFTNDYYSFPTVVFAMPSLAYWIYHFVVNKKIMTIIAVSCTAILTGFSIPKSVDHVLFNLNARKNDMPTIEFIAEQHLKGVPVLMYTNGIDINMFRYDRVRGEDFAFKVYRYFINYVLYQEKSNNRNIVVPVERINNLPEHCVLLCHKSVETSKKQQLINDGFKLIYSNNVYVADYGVETYMR